MITEAQHQLLYYLLFSKCQHYNSDIATSYSSNNSVENLYS